MQLSKATDSYPPLRPGFSLLEALLGISIGAVLLSFVLSIYMLSIRSIHSSESRAELTQNSRVLLERITRDVRQARAIATILPATESGPPEPPDEIEMQDGHNTSEIQYVRYYVSDGNMYRQVKRYYFASDPGVYVTYDARDEFDNPPQTSIIEDELAAEYVDDISFYGEDMLTVALDLKKNTVSYSTFTNMFLRNK